VPRSLPTPETIVPIDETAVKKIAKLANLALNADEVQRMSRELEAIVGYIESLKTVDTTGVEAIANVAGLSNVVRADRPAAMLTSKQVLGNAPKADEVAFLVPKAVER